jgi:hypothetical protein
MCEGSSRNLSKNVLWQCVLRAQKFVWKNHFNAFLTWDSATDATGELAVLADPCPVRGAVGPFHKNLSHSFLLGLPLCAIIYVCLPPDTRSLVKMQVVVECIVQFIEKRAGLNTSSGHYVSATHSDSHCYV